MTVDSIMWCDTNGRFHNRELDTVSFAKSKKIQTWLEAGDFNNGSITGVRDQIRDTIRENKIPEGLMKFINLFSNFFSQKKIDTLPYGDILEYISIINDFRRISKTDIPEEYVADYFEGFYIITEARKRKLNIFDDEFLDTHQNILQNYKQIYINFKLQNPEKAPYVESLHDTRPGSLHPKIQKDIQKFMDTIGKNTQRLMGK